MPKTKQTEPIERANIVQTDDAIADRILKAFDGHDYLNDADLLHEAGVGREKYLSIISWLTEQTNELIEHEPSENDTEQVLYSRLKPRAEVTGNPS